jgi:hypothetical protein
MPNTRHPNGSYSGPKVSCQAPDRSLNPNQNQYQIIHGPFKNFYLQSCSYPDTLLQWAIPNPRSSHESAEIENFYISSIKIFITRKVPVLTVSISKFYFGVLVGDRIIVENLWPLFELRGDNACYVGSDLIYGRWVIASLVKANTKTKTKT